MKTRLLRAVAALAIALGAAAVPSGAAPVHAGSRVCTGWTSTVVPPTAIRVYSSALKRTEVVPFRTYVEKVIASEWGPRPAAAALRAGAIAIKQYAWYYAIHWRGKSDPNGNCYDVSDSSGDQVYRASRAPSDEQRAAVDATWWVSLRKGTTFFLTGYRPGTGTCLARLDGWHLYPRNAVACVHQFRDTTETLLRRFYSRLSIATPGTNDATGDRRGDALLSITDPATGDLTVRTLTADSAYVAAAAKHTTEILGTSAATSVLGRVAADVTGDGLVDIVELIQDGNGAALRVMRAATTGFAKATTWWSSARDPNTKSADLSGLHLVAGDFTGDGLADAGLVVTTASQAEFLVARSTGSAFAATARRLVVTEDLTAARFVSGDFSGDSRADLAILSPVVDASGAPPSQVETRVAVTQTNLKLAAPVRWALDSTAMDRIQVVVADLARTGRDDLVLATRVVAADPSAPTSTRFKIYRSNGSTFVRSWWGASDPSLPFDATRFSVADWDGDGRGDVLAFVDLGTAQGTVAYRYTSIGTRFARADLLRDANLVWANFTAQ